MRLSFCQRLPTIAVLFATEKNQGHTFVSTSLRSPFMPATSRWKPKFHHRLVAEQLEDRSLPNTILQIMGTSLLSPTFLLMDPTEHVDAAVLSFTPPITIR